MSRSRATLGGLLRALSDSLDRDVDAAYAESGLDYRARFTPVVRRLADLGPASIKEIAADLGLSHSALSQTVAELRRRGWVDLTPGADGRERQVALTAAARAHLPRLRRHWAATARAAATLDDELGLQLEATLRAALAALDARPFRERIRDAERERNERRRRP